MPIRPTPISKRCPVTCPANSRVTTRVIKLNTNENPYPCSPKVGEAVRAVLGEGLRKYPHPMAGPFREKASEVLGVDPEWILCGNGSDDILTICTRTFVGEGELLRLPYPSYILYKTLAEIQNARSEEIPIQGRLVPFSRLRRRRQTA